VREVAALYAAFAAGEPDPLPALPVQYADYAAWQRAWLQGERLQAQVDFWTAHLRGAPGAAGAADGSSAPVPPELARREPCGQRWHRRSSSRCRRSRAATARRCT
jgi:hypothetical protein